MPISIGDRVGHYEVTGHLGAGGMGVVLLARDTKLGRQVALKVLPPAFADDPDRLKRFQREAEILASLNHPNIAIIHGLEETRDTSALVLELVEGPTLAELLEQAAADGGPPSGSGLPIERVLSITTQIAAALEAAHAQGIIHRDLKPANIKVRDDGTVKVLDFGLAKVVFEQRDDVPSQAETVTVSQTLVGAVVGTPAYMSPEQVRGTPLDARTDVWAFGCVLCELLNGRRVFAGDTTVEILAAVLEREPHWTALPTTTPAAMLALARRCLDRDVGRRPASGADLRGALSAVDSSPIQVQAPARSLAVLPFANMSADPDQDYFCEGLAEELIDALARLDGLRVVARTSSFQFKGRSHDVRRVGEQLSVAAVLEGSVRKAGNRVRISAQLINAADGYHLWSERFDRELTDIFAVQDEIAHAVVERLRVDLLAGTGALVPQATTSQPAHASYLRGRHYQFSRYSFLRALQCYEEAARLDANYPAAWAGVADAIQVACYLSLVPPREAAISSRTAAERALALDGNLSEAHAANARVRYWFDWDWRAAEHAFRQAVMLNPGNITARIEYAHLLAVLGHFDEALAETERARQLDPLSARVGSRTGMILLLARRYDEAMTACREALELQPDQPAALWYLNLVQLAASRPADAVSTLARVPAPASASSLHQGFLGAALALTGDVDEARVILREQQARGAREYVAPYDMARICVGLGDIASAAEYLQRSYEERNPTLVLMWLPGWDAVREHPGVRQILQGMRLPALA